MYLKIVFSTDATGLAKDSVEHINIPNDVCLYCLHDKNNRFHDEVKKRIEKKGYDLKHFFQIMKIYSL